MKVLVKITTVLKGAVFGRFVSEECLSFVLRTRFSSESGLLEASNMSLRKTKEFSLMAKLKLLLTSTYKRRMSNSWRRGGQVVISCCFGAIFFISTLYFKKENVSLGVLANCPVHLSLVCEEVHSGCMFLP